MQKKNVSINSREQFHAGGQAVTQNSNFNDILHSDARIYIFSFLNIKDILTARLVCRDWLQDSKNILTVKAIISNQISSFKKIEDDLFEKEFIKDHFDFLKEKELYQKSFIQNLTIPIEIFLFRNILRNQKSILPDGFQKESPADYCLSLAYEKGDIESVRGAIRLGANIHNFDNLHFKSVSDYLTQKPFIQILLMLKNMGANITIVDQNKILDEAYKYADLEMIQAMLDDGAKYEKNEPVPYLYGEVFSALDVEVIRSSSEPKQKDAGYFSSNSSYTDDQRTSEVVELGQLEDRLTELL